MRLRPSSRLMILALTLAAVAVTAHAETSLVLGIQDHRLNIDTGLLEIDPVENDQTSVRATWTWDVDDRWTVIAQGGVASSYLELTDERLNGPTDLRVRALYRPGDRWAVGVGTIVPFGLYELTANEVTTAQWTWNPRSGFPLGLFGEGWGWEATAAYALPLGELTSLGLAGAYLRHAEFSLLEAGAGEYRLGDEISASAAVDYVPGGGRHVRALAAFKLYGTDTVNGVDLVDQGNQVDLGIALDVPAGSWFTAWSAHLMVKDDNALFSPADGDTAAVISQAPGTYLTASGRVGRAVGRATHLYGEVTLTNVSGSDYAIGSNGTYLSAGPGFGWRASDRFSVGGRVAYITGTGDDDLSFDGYDLLATLEFRP